MQIKSEMKCHESQKFEYHVVEICFPDSEHITFKKMHLVLSKIEPLKVWLKYIGPRTVHQKSWIFLWPVVAFCSESQNI